ncbi:MAG: CHAD domain-containing protein [Bryobacteraceae bacterium]
MRRYAIEQVTNLLARLAFEVRRTLRSHDAPSIHDLRVTGRRLEQALELFAPFFPQKERKKVRKRLRQMMDAAGKVRNYDVVMDLAGGLGLASSDPVTRKLRETRDGLARELATLLKKFTRRDFSSRWRNRLGLIDVEPPRPKAAQMTVAKSARYTLPLAAAEFFQAGRKAFESDRSSNKALHEFRLVAKSFRYSLELFAPIYGPALRKRLESLQQLQRLLGEVHDCVVARSLLLEDGVHKRNGLADRLEILEQARRENFRRYWNNRMDSPGEQQLWVAYLSQFAGRRRNRILAAAAR